MIDNRARPRNLQDEAALLYNAKKQLNGQRITGEHQKDTEPSRNANMGPYEHQNK